MQAITPYTAPTAIFKNKETTLHRYLFEIFGFYNHKTDTSSIFARCVRFFINLSKVGLGEEFNYSSFCCIRLKYNDLVCAL